MIKKILREIMLFFESFFYFWEQFFKGISEFFASLSRNLEDKQSEVKKEKEHPFNQPLQPFESLTPERQEEILRNEHVARLFLNIDKDFDELSSLKGVYYLSAYQNYDETLFRKFLDKSICQATLHIGTIEGVPSVVAYYATGYCDFTSEHKYFLYQKVTLDNGKIVVLPIEKTKIDYYNLRTQIELQMEGIV